MASSHVRVSVDEHGRLVELVNLQTGLNYASSSPLVRLIFQREQCLECFAQVVSSASRVEASDDTITIVHEAFDTIDARAEITISIVDDEVRLGISLHNHDNGTIIRECFFPMISPLRYPDDHALITSEMGGKRFEDPHAEVDSHRTLYVALDEFGPVKTAMYPGNRAAMNCFMFAGESQGLYIASHDDSFQYTQHYWRLMPEGLETGMVKYPFLKQGCGTSIDSYVISPYSGSWHNGARKYRRWVDSWFKDPSPIRPKWVGHLNGWQRLILKHQYGLDLLRYDEIHRAFREGQNALVDGIMLFGWHADGHDAGYPHYPFDDAQGGRDKLIEQIRRVQADGGRVMLYFNGHLIEIGSEYYNRIGKRICSRDYHANPYIEEYRFSGKGTLLRQFGNRKFVGACPACEEWFEHLKTLCDIAIDLGVDSVFFDQMGGSDNVLCCDESHGHRVPFTTIGAAKRRLLERLREYVHSKAPKMALGTEIICDSTIGCVDYAHAYTGGCEAAAPARPGEKVKTTGFGELFRFAFPEPVYSDRDIRDDTDIPRRLAHALGEGLISDVEIYRCRATIKEAPNYQQFLVEINRLRNKWGDLLLRGNYRDTLGFDVDNDEVDAHCFTAGDVMAIVASQHHLPTARAHFKTPGYRYVECDGIGPLESEATEDGARVTLPTDAVAVCIFRHDG